MPPERPTAGGDKPERILVSREAAASVPLPVLKRCGKKVMERRPSFPPNDSWQEAPVEDIDHQLVVMVCSVQVDPEGRRVLAIDRARYKPREGR